jgi:hypothetical protein
MTTEMPKFTFNNLEFKDDAELEAFEKEQKGGGYVDKYFKPGQHDVTIADVEINGMSEKDDTWVKLCVHLKGTGEKTIRSYLQVPTDRLKYGAKNSTWPLKTLKNFCAALGQPLPVENIKTVLNNVFAKPEKLVGRPLVIQVGYQKGYVKYVGKGDGGAKLFNIFDKDNNVVRDLDGTAINFPDQAAAMLYADDNKIPVDKYPSVLGYAPSTAQGENKSAAWF